MPLITHRSPRRRSRAVRQGFSLVEVAIALGIVAFAMLSILGLAQMGIFSLKESVNDSITGLILHDVRARIDGEPFPSAASLSSGANTTLSPFFYDRSGMFLATDGSGHVAHASYRVDVSLGGPNSALPHARAAVAVVTIRWPLDPDTGDLSPGAQKRQLSFLVTPATDGGWTNASPSYQPRINQ